MKIGFWKPQDKYGEFSNWYKCKFNYKEIDFISSEQALMYMKAITFNDIDIANKILSTENQRDIKALGRMVSNYNESIWSKVRYNIMVEILYCKFEQNPSLSSLLLSTSGNELYEASPYDSIWGIGSKNVNIINGSNLLGKALMEVRDKLN